MPGRFTRSKTRFPEAGRNMARILCGIDAVAKGAPRTFTRFELSRRFRGMLATRQTLAYFSRKGWVKRAGVRAHPYGIGGTGYFVLTRRGARAAKFACAFSPRLRRRKKR